MKKILSVFLLLTALSSLRAENISVSGSVEGNVSLDYYNKDSYLYESAMGDYSLDNYLKFSPNVKLPEIGSAFAVFNADLLVQELISSKNNETEQNITFTLNEAYLNVELSPFLFFTLGKKRVIWGVGLFYNPSDFINPPKDPLNPGEERRGVYCALLELFTDFLSISQAVVIYDQLDHFGYGSKLSTSALITATDLNLIFYYSAHAGFNLGASIDSTPFGELPILQNLALHAEAGFSQKSSRLIFDGSTGGLNVKETRDDFYKSFLAGLRYTIPGWETFIATEYYYIDDGYSPSELAAIIASGFITSIVFEPGLMCRHNLMISINQPQLTQNTTAFTDTLSLSSTLLLNLLDGSFYLEARAESSIIENCLFSLEAGCFYGRKKAEYGLSPAKVFINLAVTIGF